MWCIQYKHWRYRTCTYCIFHIHLHASHNCVKTTPRSTSCTCEWTAHLSVALIHTGMLSSSLSLIFFLPDYGREETGSSEYLSSIWMLYSKQHVCGCLHTLTSSVSSRSRRKAHTHPLAFSRTEERTNHNDGSSIILRKSASPIQKLTLFLITKRYIHTYAQAFRV